MFDALFEAFGFAVLVVVGSGLCAWVSHLPPMKRLHERVFSDE